MPDLAEIVFPDLGTGQDGHVVISGNTDLGSANVKNYISLIVNSSVTLQGNNGVDIRVKSVLINNGTIHANGKVSANSSAAAPEGIAGDNGGGGGGSLFSIGGNGGFENNQTDGNGVAVATASPLNLTTFTSLTSTGGGLGGDGQNGTGGPAGLGGGALRIRAYVINGTGTISSNGTAGSVGTGGASGNGAGGGGGGAGGYLEIFSVTSISNQTLQAKGANGANGVGSAGAGGSGGGGGSGGFICVYSTSFSGSTSVTHGNGGTKAGTLAQNGFNGNDGYILEITL